MKILYVVTSADLGGAQKSVLLLAKHFGGEIAAGTEKSQLFDEALRQQIIAHRLKYLKRGINPVFDLLAALELYRLIKKLRPDIVHLNSSKAGFTGSIAAKLAGAKVVYSARGFVFNEPRTFLVKWLFVSLEKFASRFRDLIITVSTADKKSALKYHLALPEKIITIHNAVPPTEFISPTAARQNLGVPDDSFVIGTIANFYPTKGLDILIEALNQIKHSITGGWLCVIIGSGPLGEDLKSQTMRLGLSSNVIFSGGQPNAASLLRALDLFVLPSRKEGFPLTLLEALQAGRPILATDVGGNRELLGAAGQIIPPENPTLLGTALLELINDPVKRAELTKRALARAQVFSLDKLFAESDNAYRKILKH